METLAISIQLNSYDRNGDKACTLTVEMFKLDRDDFITVGGMYELAEGENTQVIFV